MRLARVKLAQLIAGGIGWFRSGHPSQDRPAIRATLRLPLALTAVIAFSGPLDASADFIGFEDARSIFASERDLLNEGVACNGVRIGTAGISASGTPSSPFSAWSAQVQPCASLPFSGGVVVANQTSSFTATRLEGSGEAKVNDAAPYDDLARSTYSITFDVATATPFSLTGVLSRNAFGSTSISLTGESEIFAFSPSDSSYALRESVNGASHARLRMLGYGWLQIFRCGPLVMEAIEVS